MIIFKKNMKKFHFVVLSEEYYAFGQYVALAIMQQCGTPHLFCQGLAAYLLGMYVCWFDELLMKDVILLPSILFPNLHM